MFEHAYRIFMYGLLNNQSSKHIRLSRFDHSLQLSRKGSPRWQAIICRRSSSSFCVVCDLRLRFRCHDLFGKVR